VNKSIELNLVVSNNVDAFKYFPHGVWLMLLSTLTIDTDFEPVHFFNLLFTHPVYFLRYVVIVSVSIGFHELAHGIAAIREGDDTPEKAGHMTLNPIQHMGWESMVFLCLAGVAWGQMPINSDRFRSASIGRIRVAAAGPLFNLMLAIGCLVVLKLIVVTALGKVLSAEFFFLAAQINLILFLFNLVPLPPLDGFHIFSEYFPSFKPIENNPWSLFALVILFLVADFGTGLQVFSNWIIEMVIGKTTLL
jgi:Zn-dependent protease